MDAEVVEALRLMTASAKVHEQAHQAPEDEEPPFCSETRAQLVATLMYELELGVEDLGFVASAFLDLVPEQQQKIDHTASLFVRLSQMSETEIDAALARAPV